MLIMGKIDIACSNENAFHFFLATAVDGVCENDVKWQWSICIEFNE